MIHVFFGKDQQTARKEAHQFAHDHAEAGGRIERIDSTSYQEGMVRDVVGSQSLFGDQTIYIFDTPSADPDFEEEIKEVLEVIAEQTGLFIIIENALLAPQKKHYARYTEHLHESNAPAKERFNTFALSDALIARNKKQLWMGMSDAVHAGVSAEEIIGILWWQLKTLRLVAETPDARSADMKDFTYNKAKRALGAFKEGEIERLSASLLLIYHQGHAGMQDIDLALEKWVLTL
jgi:DNA polymerase III delta subunit